MQCEFGRIDAFGEKSDEMNKCSSCCLSCELVNKTPTCPLIFFVPSCFRFILSLSNPTKEHTATQKVWHYLSLSPANMELIDVGR